MGSLPKRVGVLEQENRVLQHRVKTLEETPPRVTILEQNVGVLKAEWGRMRDDLVDIKSEGHQTRESVDNLTKAVNANSTRVGSLFLAGMVIAGVLGAAVGAVKLYDTTLSIQQKRQAIEARQDHKPEAVG